jgi:hypothetical protein
MVSGYGSNISDYFFFYVPTDANFNRIKPKLEEPAVSAEHLRRIHGLPGSVIWLFKTANGCTFADKCNHVAPQTQVTRRSARTELTREEERKCQVHTEPDQLLDRASRVCCRVWWCGEASMSPSLPSL